MYDDALCLCKEWAISIAQRPLTADGGLFSEESTWAVAHHDE